MTDFFGVTDKEQLKKLDLVLNVFNESNDKNNMLKKLKELIK